MKVITLIGTRPELIKLSSVIKKLDKAFEHIIVHTGQNYDYELNEIFFNDLKIRQPDYYLNSAKSNVASTIGDVISKSDKIFSKEKPDALLILGDTNSCLSAISAKRKKIPIFHMEAGNRCFDQRVPEEINRKIVDHISDINMPYSSIARDYLLSEGLPPSQIIKTGSPMLEVINENLSKIKNSKILSDLNLKKGKYFVASIHREENIDNSKRFKTIISSLNHIAEKYSLPVIFSVHPRTLKRLKSGKLEVNKNILLSKPLAFSDYISLQTHSTIVLSDSGTITEEASLLKFKAINMRENHERPEGFEEGALILGGNSMEEIISSVELMLKSDFVPSVVSDYDVSNVSDKVVRIIKSYTDYINKFVWKKI